MKNKKKGFEFIRKMQQDIKKHQRKLVKNILRSKISEKEKTIQLLQLFGQNDE
jgi:hypothetical protein